MAKERRADKTKEASSEEEPSGSKRTKLLIGVVAVALLAGGYVMTSGGGGTDAAAAPEEPAAPAEGDVVSLETITLNLADGRFLKVGLALQLVEGVPAPAAGDVQGFAAPALDEAISLLGTMSYDQLVAPGGRDGAKAELSTRIGERYDGDVMGVYFTELVMQ